MMNTFNANDDQVSMWKDDTMQVIKPKARGSGLMVSDFNEERDGYCALSDSMFQNWFEVEPTIEKSARVFFLNMVKPKRAIGTMIYLWFRLIKPSR